MCCSSQSFPGVKLVKIWLAFGLATTLIPFEQPAMAQSSHAEPASAVTVPTSSEGFGVTIFWIGAGIFACLAAAGGVILARKFHQQKALAIAGGMPDSAPQKHFSLPVNGNGSKSLRLNNRPAKSAKMLNNNHANGNNSKRRRMFNYHKFYTEMVLQGPSPTSMADSGYGAYNGYNGYYVEYEMPRINGNGHNGNGSTNGHTPADAAEHNSSTVDSHATLIATQKSLIEEQLRLIQEQARLIQEKSRLIEEKNQLLERQSQMLDNNLL
jgi:hypothetical protein